MGAGQPVSRSRALPVALIFAAVFLAALNLRAGIAAVGPVLGDVLADFQASGQLAGIITAMPGAFFAAMGLAAVPVARRLGLSRTLLLGMGLTLTGTAIRPWVDDAWLFIGLTALVVAGIALANVLLPAWIKLHGGRHIVTLMTINTSVLGASGALGPLSVLLYDEPGGWRRALFFWVWIALGQVTAWLFVALRTGYDFPHRGPATAAGDSPGDAESRPEAAGAPRRRKVSLFTSPTAVFLMVFFGLQSMNAYVQMGFLPQILIDGGASQSAASVALSLVGAMNILGGLVMPSLINKVPSLAPYIVAIAGFALAGYAVLLLAPDSLAMLSALLLGIGGWAFPSALALIVARSREPEVTARLSGFVQPIGYLFPALAPLIVGAVYDPTNPSWDAVIWALMIATLIQGAVGVRASRAGVVDDELNARAKRLAGTD